MSKIDPGRVLELLEKQPFQGPGSDDASGIRVATELLATDPVEAESIVAAIASPGLAPSVTYGWLRPCRSRSEIGSANFWSSPRLKCKARDCWARGQPWHRIFELGQIAEGWLKLGEVEKARPLIREGLELVARLPKVERYHRDFLPIAARLEPERVLSLIGDLAAPPAAGQLTSRLP